MQYLHKYIHLANIIIEFDTQFLKLLNYIFGETER